MGRRIALILFLVLVTVASASAGRRRRRAEPAAAPTPSSVAQLRAAARDAFPCLGAPGPSAARVRLLGLPGLAEGMAQVRKLLLDRADQTALRATVSPLLAARTGVPPQSVLEALFLDFYEEGIERAAAPGQTGVAAKTARSVALQSLVRAAQALTAAAGRPGVAISNEPVLQPKPRRSR